MDQVGIGIIGSGFVSEIHVESIKRMHNARAVAVASPTPAHVEAFAAKHGIPKHFTDYRAVLDLPEVDVVLICLPNDLHCQVCCDAALAKKHVICEKPLCPTLAEADRMIDTCREQGVKLMYAEELCFTPKYVRAKQLCDSGALGKLFRIKQCEKHDGPHMPWFWDVERSGGGVTLDMGCHAFEYFRWMLGKPRVKSVWADMGTFVHGEKTKGDDDSLIVVEFEGGARGVAEESWAKPGGMDDRIELYGSEGVILCDLLHGSAFQTYSKRGYDYAVEKAGSTVGWSFTMYEEAWNYGFPQELAHFVDCVLNDTEPLETGEDGRAVLEIILAAYESAGTGRKVTWPYDAPRDKTPHEAWGR
ncbi:MAG: Gfo/Idh/MocA family oxidoreductase [Acidobacteriota bacterium]|nr:Gfo/Idh/MocA family oxidoreductase [Acidobacteriota bacterium]